jgi:diguanylate cyclase (GGDEF)-like protein
MNIENLSTGENHDDNLHYDSSPSMNSLVVELEHYRRQSEWLSLVNELHGRLAGVVDLSSMLEAFSVWLMPLIHHELLAYSNQLREQRHLLCSSHGPERRRAMQIAKSAFNNVPECETSCCWTQDEFYIQSWTLDTFQGSGILLILRKDRQIGEYESQIIAKGLKILGEPLQRALEYEDLYIQACRDSLTGLVNRRVFDERIGPVLAQSKRHGHPVTLACMDLDKFKKVNDTYGHDVGDLLLQKVSSTMNRLVRSCDVLARMGGDEFMLIMPDTDLVAAKMLADRLCKSIGNLKLSPLNKEEIGISIGLAEWNPQLDKKEWIRKADEALYKAKAGGRSRVCAL